MEEWRDKTWGTHGLGAWWLPVATIALPLLFLIEIVRHSNFSLNTSFLMISIVALSPVFIGARAFIESRKVAQQIRVENSAVTTKCYFREQFIFQLTKISDISEVKIKLFQRLFLNPRVRAYRFTLENGTMFYVSGSMERIETLVARLARRTVSRTA